MLEANTQPGSPEILNNMVVENPGNTSKEKSGQKKRRKNRRIQNEKIIKLKERVKKAEKKAAKYKKRAQRLEASKKDTPKKKVEKLINTQSVSPQIKKQLLFGQVLIKQLKENFKDRKKYRKVITGVAGKIIKKYKMTSALGSILSSKALRHANKAESSKLMKRKYELAKKHVVDFLEKDDNSRLCPGKRDTVTRKQDKRQKRYLNDFLTN